MLLHLRLMDLLWFNSLLWNIFFAGLSKIIIKCNTAINICVIIPLGWFLTLELLNQRIWIFQGLVILNAKLPPEWLSSLTQKYIYLCVESARFSSIYCYWSGWTISIYIVHRVLEAKYMGFSDDLWWFLVLRRSDTNVSVTVKYAII